MAGPREAKEAGEMLAALDAAEKGGAGMKAAPAVQPSTVEAPTAAAAAAAAGAAGGADATTTKPASTKPAASVAAPSSSSPLSSSSSSSTAAADKGEEEGESVVLVGPRPGYRRVVIAEEDGEEEEKGNSTSPSTTTSRSTTAVVEEEEAEALKAAGNAALQAGDAQGAVDAYTKALGLLLLPSASTDAGSGGASSAKKVTLHAALLNNRGLARLRLGEYEEAMDDATAMLALEPGNAKARYRRGKAGCARAKGVLDGGGGQGAEALLEGAVGDLEAVVRADPRNAEARRELEAAQGLLPRAQAAGWALRKKGERGGGGGTTGDVAAKKPAKAPTQPALFKPRGATAATAAAATPAASASSASLLQEVTTRPRLLKPPPPPQEQEQKENAVPSSATATTPSTAKPPSHPAAPATPPTPTPSTPPGLREPSGPPRTLHELEREWRTLRKDPSALARYLRKFSAATFPRVVKPATDSDVVSGVFRVVAGEWCGEEEEKKGEPACVLRVLEGMSRVEGFGMMRMMLSAADQAHVRRALGVLEAAVGGGVGVTAEAVAALRAKYQM